MNAQKKYSLEQLHKRFIQKFGQTDKSISAFFAPGRVNLIGEYTDFTGGLVFPCGINQGTTLLIRRNYSHQYRFASTNFDLMAQLEQSEISTTYDDNWINYPLGVLDQYTKCKIPLDGFDCLYSGNVPNGAGLSSSASIQVLTAFAINELMQTGYSLLKLVRLSQSAENDFVGLQCGIMDQFAVAFAESNHAILLDCHTQEHRQVPLRMNGISIVVSNTNQRRELNDSAYNDRVSECQRALDILSSTMSITHLGQLLPEELDQHETLFANDPIALNRARHVCEENARVKAAVPALEASDMHTFGSLMNQSHDSLHTLFEVSSKPLNQLVRLAREQKSVLGSRMTGAGFGGCTVTLLPTVDVDAFKHTVGAAYQQCTGLTADFYDIQPGNGVRKIHTEILK